MNDNILRTDLVRGERLGNYDVHRLPESDAEVKGYIATMFEDFETARAVWGCYRCSRMEGKEVLQSYKEALREYLGMAEKT